MDGWFQELLWIIENWLFFEWPESFRHRLFSRVGKEVSAIKTLNVWGIQGVFMKLKKKKLNSTANIWAGATDCCFDTRHVVRQQVFLHLLLSYRGNRRQAFILDVESSHQENIY